MKSLNPHVRRSLAIVGVVTLSIGMSSHGFQPLEAGHHAVPSLTAWGKIFSCLLLAALGVAYLVWRRPMMRARAILETSPLGSRQVTADLVDWFLYLKTLLAVEAGAMGCLVLLRFSGKPLSTLDTWGVAGAGAIVAFVFHLLLLNRRGDDNEGVSKN